MIINPLANDVTWYSSSQVGSPKIDALDPNGLLKVLDACLVTGWGEKDILNTVIDGDLITLNYGVGHGCNLYQNILITGANDPLLNGIHKVVDLTNNTVTIRVVGALLNTGLIKAKIAPLGWESVFGTTDTLRRAYRSLSAKSSKNIIYLDMGYPVSAGYAASAPIRRATVSVCEDMTVLGEQINSITNSVNDFATNPNGSLFWYQARNDGKNAPIIAGGIPWKVVGNGEFFYLCIASGQYDSKHTKAYHSVFGFGEYIGLSDAQPNRVFLSAHYSPNDTAPTYTSDLAAKFSTASSGSAVGTYCFVNDNGAFSRCRVSPISNTASIIITSGLTGVAYPSANGDLLFTTTLRILDSSAGTKGFMPSYVTVDHEMSGSFDNSVIDGMLIVRAPSDKEPSSKAANVAFYVGE